MRQSGPYSVPAVNRARRSARGRRVGRGAVGACRRRGRRPGSTRARDHNGAVSDPDPIESDEFARYGLGRLLSLSDGVFAIALTVLVLSLHVDVATPAADVGGAIHRSWSEVY